MAVPVLRAVVELRRSVLRVATAFGSPAPIPVGPDLPSTSVSSSWADCWARGWIEIPLHQRPCDALAPSSEVGDAEAATESVPGDVSCYGDLLRLDLLLGLQRPIGPSSHAMLFAVLHQTCELWFKALSHESVIAGPIPREDADF